MWSRTIIALVLAVPGTAALPAPPAAGAPPGLTSLPYSAPYEDVRLKTTP